MIIGSKIYHQNKIYNSLDWAKENIDNAPDGSIFIADEHEKARARQGRPWIFNKGQLAITIILKPQNINSIKHTNLSLRLNQLNMAITLGILKILRKYDIELKWSNDFYYKGKKLGGILSQVIWKNNSIIGIIFGFGINVNNEIPKLDNKYYKAISIKEITGKKIDKNELEKNIFKSIDLFYKKWLDQKYNEIFLEWRKNQDYIGKTVTVHRQDTSWITGIFKDVLENGDMVLKKGSEKFLIPFHVVDNLY
ncbi:biotin--[acetyl-CoA-carboxylase] ligase [Candidatus Dependentiae bacterium]|nr:biotin--[acetyl-CoA-carboxylase] ligase [Candidatus Dependentiae bacterium]